MEKFTPEKAMEVIENNKRLNEHDRLARIERWAGMAMQGMLSNSEEFASTWKGLYEYAFDKAEAMEAEYQKRYNNNTKQD